MDRIRCRQGLDEVDGGNADFGAIFLYLIRRVENVMVGGVVVVG